MSWERQASGPDWQDLAATIRSLEKVHKCTVFVLVLGDGRNVSPGISFTVAASRADLSVESMSSGPAVGGLFPSRSHRRLEGAIYKALIELDVECTKLWWAQKGLPWPER